MTDKKKSKGSDYFRSVEFFKSVQFSSRDLGDDYFIALGNLQYMRPETNGGLDIALDLAKSKLIKDAGGNNERLYTKHSLHFFCFDEEENKKGYIIGFPDDEDRFLERESHFYIVTTLNLNRRVLLPESYDDFFLSVKSKVKDTLDELGIEARLYVGLGSNDLVLLAKSIDFCSLLLLPTALRKIRHNETDECVFIDSHTIPLVHYNFDLNEIAKTPRKFSIELRYELLDIEQESHLLGIYHDLFPKKDSDGSDEFEGKINEIRCSRRYGTYDISLHLNLPSLFKVFYILGVRGENAKNALKTKLKDPDFELFDKNVKLLESFGSKYIGLHLRRLSGPKIEAEIPSSDLNDVITPVEPPYLLLAKKMDLLIDEIKPKIPRRALRTLNFIYAGCLDLLGTEKRELSGFRMYTLFGCVLNLIAEGQFEGAAIIRALGTLSSALNDIMLADNVDFENIMDIDPETLSPSIKLYHAFERSAEVIYNALSVKQNLNGVPQADTRIFLNLNPIDGFSTHPLLSRKDEFNIDLLMINLPDVSYLDPEHSFVLLAHEIGHYVNIARFGNNAGDCESLGNDVLGGIYAGTRNRTLYEMVIYYAKTICFSYAMGEFVLQVDNSKGDSLPTEKFDSKSFRFRYQIKGLDFRYGSADPESETETFAWTRAKNQNKKAERGGFYKSVRIGLIVKDSTGKPVKEEIKPNEQIVLVIDKGISVEEISAQLSYHLDNKCTIFTREDAHSDVNYIIINRPTYRKDLDAHETTFIEAVKTRVDSLNKQKSSVEGKRDTDLSVVKKEIELDGAIGAVSEYSFIDYQKTRLDSLNKAFAEALTIFHEDTQSPRKLDEAMRVLAKAHLDDSISSLWCEVKRAIVKMPEHFSERIYKLSNELVIPRQ